MLLRTATFLVLYAVAILVGRATVVPETGLALFWPAAGIGVLWCLRARGVVEPVLATLLIGLTATAGNLLTGMVLAGAVGFGVANALMALLTGVLVQRAGRGELPGDRPVRRLADLTRLLGAGSVATAAAALVAMVALALAGAEPSPSSALAFWLRNMAAIVVIAGPALTATGRWSRPPRRVVVEAVALYLVTAVCLWLVFGPGHHLPLAFVPLALVGWAALRLPLPLAAGEGALVAVGALALSSLLPDGIFGMIADVRTQGVVLQAFMMLAVTAPLVLATVLAERDDLTAGLTQAKRTAERTADDLRAVTWSLPVGLMVIDEEGTVELHNDAALRWLPVAAADGEQGCQTAGVRRDLQGREIPVEEWPSTRALRGEHVRGSVLVIPDPENGDRTVSISGVPLSSAGGDRAARALLLMDDVTEDQRRVEELTFARARFARLVEDAPHGVAVIDMGGRVIQANRALAAILGRDVEALVGVSASELTTGDPEQVATLLERTVIGRGAPVEGEWEVATADGAVLQLSCTGRFLQDGARHGQDPEILLNLVDVSERRRYEERLAHLVHHDELTGLPNRRRFDEALEEHRGRCARHGPRGALLLLDLDHFKEVNDTLGHHSGDALLVEVATVLRGALRETDLVARLGGDEFAVLLAEADAVGAQTVAATLVARVREHCAGLEGARRRVSASVGVVTFEAAQDQDTDALTLADMLLYDAKDAGRNRHAGLTDEGAPAPRFGARLDWQGRLERALEEDLFTLHLQPILDLRTGTVTGAEALVRLVDRGEVVLPGEFVHVAELAGLAPALDAWVVRHALDLLVRLQQHRPGFTIEVNLSGHSIGDAYVERTLVDALARTGVAPSTLVLEVTETAAIADVAAAQRFANRLRAMGVRFALDDFGAGYGSFYYLKHLDFDHVKIDGEFVSDAHRSPVDREILGSIVSVARNLGKTTVAEYVGDVGALEVVRALRVDYAQGYLVGRPLAYPDFVAVHFGAGSLRPVLVS